MSKSSKQKNKKIEKRKKKSALKKKAAIKQKIKNAAIEKRLKEYPNFHYRDYDKEIVSERFVKEVKEILNNLDFNDSSLFDLIEQGFLKMMKVDGFLKAQNLLKIKLSDKSINDKIRRNAENHTLIAVGFALFKKLEQKGLLESYFPYNDVAILPKPPEFTDFIVTFEGLLWKKTQYVAFSKHAIERICTRYVDDWKLYDCAGAVFDLLNNYINFELIQTTYNDEVQYFLTLYDSMEEGCPAYHYLANILEDYDINKKYYYRIGYCPIGFSGNYASAKTLLAPGMRGTPEFIRMKESGLKFSEQKKFEKLANLQLKKLCFSDHSYYDALRWYQDNGVSQVVQLEEDPFRYN